MSDQEGSLWWSMEGSTLRIGGQGSMENRQHAYDYPWYACKDEITAAVIEPGVQNLGNHAFEGCRHLAHVTLPEGLRELGDSCFSRSALEEIALPAGLRCIQSSLFRGCMQLRKVTMPDSVEEIRYSAFESCRNLTRLRLSRGLKTIGSYAFLDAGLKQLDLPEGLKTIGELAFCGLPLQELVIPDSVEEVKGRLNSRLSLYPIRLPKGKEDMPVLEPTSPEQRLRHLAFTLFRGRGDVLLRPSGDPAADRYTALLQLLDFMESCYHGKTQFLSQSSASPGYVFFCCDEENEITDNCYDGGCGPSYETTRLGVGFHILSEEDFLQRRSQAHLVQETPFPVWKIHANNCLLDRPFGLRDRFLVDGDYPFALPEQERELSPDDQELQEAADALFGERGDIFLVPKGRPREDRFAALSLLIEIVRNCTLYSSSAYLDSFQGGQFTYVVSESMDASDCYDGGCGGIEYDTESVRVSLLTPRELQRRKAAAGKEADPNGVSVLGPSQWILEQPLGMKDSFLMETIGMDSDYSEAFSKRFKAHAAKTARLMRMGETFFEGYGEVSSSPSGSLAWDHYRAMKNLCYYVDSSLTYSRNRLDLTRENDYAPSTAQVKAGYLAYCFAIDEVSCYDGGCCGTDVERQFLRLRLLSDEELEKARANAPSSLQRQCGRRPYLIESLFKRIPSGITGRSCFADWTHLYLEQPYLYTYNLCIDVYSE